MTEIQSSLFAKALQLREENSRKIDSVEELTKWFTTKSNDKPEIHGGFAYVYCADVPEVEEELKKLKLTARCIPVEGEDEPGSASLPART